MTCPARSAVRATRRPACRRQLISCDCRFDEFAGQYDGEYDDDLDDEEDPADSETLR